MDGFSIFLRKELRESLRTNRLLVTVVSFAILGIISPVTAKYTPELLKAFGGNSGGVTIVVPTPTVKDAITQFIKNVAGAGVFIAILLPMGLVAREKERGSAAFVLTKPLSRLAFLTAKLASLGITLTAGVAVGALATYWYTALLFTPIALGGFIAASLLVLLSLLVYASFTFLGSTLMSAQLPA
ncbi:MAG: ABC transporter permease subunit, partial [Ktedonobacterales bacterium]